MVDKLINAMIAGIIGAVAFLAVQALVGSSVYDGSLCAFGWNASNGSYDFGDGSVPANLPYNSSNASASELMIHDILPLAVAIVVVALLFLGLTKVRGV